MKYAQIVEVELWVELTTLLISCIGAGLLVLVACAVTRFVEASLWVGTIAHSLRVLIILEK